jgi:hypothetical protein
MEMIGRKRLKRKLDNIDRSQRAESLTQLWRAVAGGEDTFPKSDGLVVFDNLTLRGNQLC